MYVKNNRGKLLGHPKRPARAPNDDAIACVGQNELAMNILAALACLISPVRCHGMAAPVRVILIERTVALLEGNSFCVVATFAVSVGRCDRVIRDF